MAALNPTYGLLRVGVGNRSSLLQGAVYEDFLSRSLSVRLIDVFDGRDSEKISIALIIHSLDLLPRRVCGEDRRMAAGFGNRKEQF